MPASAAPEFGDAARDFAEAVERYRRNWVGQLVGISGHLSRRVIDRLERECDYSRIRPSLGPFISLVWREPRPLTELAQQLSISRQACTKIARLAEEDGYVERLHRQKEDRAQSVLLTKRGQELVEDSVRLIFEEQASYSEWIGADRLRRFNSASSALFFALGLESQTDAGLGEAARQSIGVLPIVADRVEEELRERTRANGHDALQASHARLVALIGDGETSVSEMARLQGVSRQATGATVRSLESLGYVRRDTDTSDARAIRVQLTERGESLILDTLAALEELESEFRAAIGPRRFADLLNVAGELAGALALADELFEATPSEALPSLPTRPEGSAPGERELRAIASFLEQKLGEGAASRLGRFLCDKAEARRV